MAGFVGLSLACCMIISSVGNLSVKDAVTPSNPSQISFSGLLGKRSEANFSGRMLTIDEHELLAGFQSRPGSHPWIGEHVGKYLHAACLTYQSNHDPKLLAKITRVAKALMATQEPSGYLGTYPAGNRFGSASPYDWDVWVHKYCLIGLMAYYSITNDKTALDCCRKAVAHLIQVFKTKSISSAGTHEGMAATSILEPVLQLYQLTGEALYMDFAGSLIKAFSEKNGSHLIEDLAAQASVAKASNGKAYEMLSNLVGLCEMHRVTGKKEFLEPVLTAWNDISKRRLYLTGSGSSREHWTHDGLFPDQDEDNICETCVTVTWMQLNIQLLRFTGDSKYADALEKTVYNHLLASQKADGSAWCYYNPLDGARHPSSETTCCLSSGPRGIALIPTFAVMERDQGIDINMFEPGVYHGKMGVRVQSDYPKGSGVLIKVENAPSEQVTMRVRIPGWTKSPTAVVCGEKQKAKPGSYLTFTRKWKVGDEIRLDFPMPITAVRGTGSNENKIAFQQGPIVLAGSYSCAPNPDRMTRLVIDGAHIPSVSNGSLILDGSYERDGYLKSGGHGPKSAKIQIKPFFEIGTNGERYTVWFNTKPTVRIPESEFAGASWSTSRKGNVQNSITDGLSKTLANTYTNYRSDLDWYAVETTKPVKIKRIEFRHGRCYWDGGWFDTSAGKPEVQVKRSASGEWETIGTLSNYPTTTSAKQPNLAEGALFALDFEPISVVGVRVIGRPSSGTSTNQNFSSCSELGGF